MGGNAFKAVGYESQRMTKEEFHNNEKEVMDILQDLGIESKHIPYVREKQSFGDIDLIIVKEKDRNVKEIICNNIDKFNLTEEFVFRNGDVISILYKEKYQVDFIFTEDDVKNYHQSYLAYNDLGNLLGRIIKQSGFQHGHNGLFYVYREGNHYKELIKLTDDYSEALRILGLDVDKFYSGFETFIEMFEYVTSCKYFKKSRFALENLNNRNRVRDRKRKVYNEFLSYIENVEDGDQDVPSPFDEFDWLEARCEEIRVSRIEINKRKEKFNGKLVIEWLELDKTKMDGAVFGEFLSHVQSHSLFEDLMENGTSDDLKHYTQSLYTEFLFNRTQ